VCLHVVLLYVFVTAHMDTDNKKKRMASDNETVSTLVFQVTKLLESKRVRYF